MFKFISGVAGGIKEGGCDKKMGEKATGRVKIKSL
jgi:hypothetical protein